MERQRVAQADVVRKGQEISRDRHREGQFEVGRGVDAAMDLDESSSLQDAAGQSQASASEAVNARPQIVSGSA
ncbi:hypothetical protein C6I20_01945 [Aeromicrobium sp. A1-2]|uniref:hypothetical protein n=1 Tax=Aeromicrobium sp. A1-2 TaxID=2107713 RepID=UPI000E531F7A|nr:hypothetical protein [Aeromicrobium sp. A1-2]AXT84077.1 hypothetical protein C6I20_01945 [Aeromicrobium sp. A1-2]